MRGTCFINLLYKLLVWSYGRSVNATTTISTTMATTAYVGPHCGSMHSKKYRSSMRFILFATFFALSWAAGPQSGLVDGDTDLDSYASRKLLQSSKDLSKSMRKCFVPYHILHDRGSNQIITGILEFLTDYAVRFSTRGHQDHVHHQQLLQLPLNMIPHAA